MSSHSHADKKEQQGVLTEIRAQPPLARASLELEHREQRAALPRPVGVDEPTEHVARSGELGGVGCDERTVQDREELEPVPVTAYSTQQTKTHQNGGRQDEALTSPSRPSPPPPAPPPQSRPAPRRSPGAAHPPPGSSSQSRAPPRSRAAAPPRPARPAPSAR